MAKKKKKLQPRQEASSVTKGRRERDVMEAASKNPVVPSRKAYLWPRGNGEASQTLR